LRSATDYAVSRTARGSWPEALVHHVERPFPQDSAGRQSRSTTLHATAGRAGAAGG
jgi:hypothetical protein